MSARSPVSPRDEARIHPSVWFLISSYYPTIGGGETHARLLARELAARGWPITILTRRRKTEWAPVEDMEGTTIRRVRPTGLPRLGKYLMLLPALLTLLRHHRHIDVLYVCGLRVLGITGMLLAILTRTKVILRSEACGELSGDFIFKSPHKARIRGAWLIRGMLALRNIIFRRADRFLAISGVIHDEFLAEGIPPDRIARIPNGIDTAAFTPVDSVAQRQLRIDLGLPTGAFLFAYSGKLNRGKGLDMLVRAWARVRAVRKDAHLVLIGAGNQQFLSCETTLRGEAQARGLAASITFTGYVTRVADHLRACDAFVFPSESEALGLALIEAMSCGLPALASATGGILDIIEDGRNGRLLPVGDEAAWGEAMLELMRNAEQRQVWAEAGRRTALDSFSMTSAASAHEQLFQAMVST
jgi:glycosyltransferase involved in cell wall biosynthesis